MSEDTAWIGCDLDGCLAVYDGWKGIYHIGEPVPAIVEYVRNLIESGIEVRIFTARGCEGPAALRYVEEWALKHVGYVMKATNIKDYGMVFLIDDRAYTVEKNTGKFLSTPPGAETIHFHYSTSNPDNPAYVGDKKC